MRVRDKNCMTSQFQEVPKKGPKTKSQDTQKRIIPNYAAPKNYFGHHEQQRKDLGKVSMYVKRPVDIMNKAKEYIDRNPKSYGRPESKYEPRQDQHVTG